MPHGRRSAGVVMLIAMALLLFQGVAISECASMRHVNASPAPVEDPSVHATHAGDTGHDPASEGHDSSCPMAGLMISCGGAALPSVTVTSIPATAVGSASRLTPTFLMPPSVAGDDLFHPPRA